LEHSSYADRITFYTGDALELAPHLGISFDLVFIDADKRKYIEYYEMALSLLSPEGYILADNTLWNEYVLTNPHSSDKQTIGIKAFNDYVAEDKRVEKIILPVRDGLSIIKKRP
jgi:predicted O-methyltransferase YrrM